jgi:hypothetical protein
MWLIKKLNYDKGSARTHNWTSNNYKLISNYLYSVFAKIIIKWFVGLRKDTEGLYFLMFWASGMKFQEIYQLYETGSDRSLYFLLGSIKLLSYCALNSDPAAMATIGNDYYCYHLSWNHLRLTWTWQKSALGFKTDPKCWEIIWRKMMVWVRFPVKWLSNELKLHEVVECKYVLYYY